MNSDYNKLQEDIRLSKIPLDSAEGVIKSFEGIWLYIKSNTSLYEDDFTCQYYKFKVRNVNIETNFIYIYGSEDEDRLIINKKEIIQSESSAKNDEIKLVVSHNNVFSEIFLKEYSPRVDNRIEDIRYSNRNLIITEGKTDWKHLKRALDLLKANGRFTELDVDFLEYEDINMGNKTLEKICEYNALFSSDYLKIFVFDADNPEINKKHADKQFLYYDNNVYSVVLPVPEHRKTTPMISIEHYYTDDEIKTFDSNGRRLFFANEFDSNTSRHNIYENIYALNINPNVATNLIIDDKIYKLKTPVEKKEDIYKAEGKVNIALSKNDFAKNVFQKIPPFNEFSVEHFSQFFNVIVEIYKNYKSPQSDNAVEISRGVYHEYLKSGFQEVTLNCSIKYETAMKIKSSRMLGYSMNISSSMKQIILSMTYSSGTPILDFPIDISDVLLDFLVAKSENCFNRMYLYIYDENGNGISKKEILHTNGANIIIDRVLIELNNLIV